MRPRIPTAVPFLALCLALSTVLPTPGGAQAVEGTLVHAERDHALPAARLYLVAEDGVPVDSVLTDRDGRFRLAAPAPGTYNVLFQMDGWATVPSDRFRLEQGETHQLRFPVPLISGAALHQMGELVRINQELQDALPVICGDAFRPGEAGLLVGVVRVRATRAPLPGARVAVATPDDGITRSTVSNEHGTYILCNVPTGPAVRISVEAPDGIAETTEVEIRAGTASWYDLPVGPRRR
jgi:hypothetical protein